MRLSVLLFIFCLFPFIGQAQMEGNPENWCRGGFFTRDTENFRIAVVNKMTGKKVKRAYFSNDDRSDCPGAIGCETKSYVIPGDEVLINREFNGYGCGWFVTPKSGGFVGWLKLEDLEYKKLPAKYPLQNWLGEWTDGTSTISFTNNKLRGWLNVTGDSYWKGLGDNINIGQLDNRAEPQNGQLKYSEGEEEYDCQATMRLVGKYMIVADNMHCGGMNVTFSGVYQKAARK
ncbi:MAG: hypothetical protein KF685_03620 [Acidobacteria bacterium]|nr:hypothetical protein [Acidobacteriota bacterium]